MIEKFKGKVHFVYPPHVETCVEFAEDLMKDLGQADKKDADFIVAIGGDGAALWALPEADGKPVFAITPPKSNSTGFLTEHHIHNGKQLAAALNSLDEDDFYDMVPLKIEMILENGQEITRHAYGDVGVLRQPGQAALMDLSLHFNKVCTMPQRILGNGLKVSTPLGSTGENFSIGGPALDLRSQAIAITPSGVDQPAGARSMVESADEITLDIRLPSIKKRPPLIEYDGCFVSDSDTGGSPVVALKISADRSRTQKLALLKDPVFLAAGKALRI